jgi:polyferredoxin
MKTVRRASQLFFLLLFLVLFFQTARHIDWADGGMSVSAFLPADLFLRIDPLLGWTAIVASRSLLLSVLLWTVPVLLLTLLFGRAFCGWVCPLGTLVDGADKVVRPRRERRTSRERSWPRLKYYVLGAVAASALLGSQLVWLLDPIALTFRSLTLGFFAPLERAVQWLPGMGRLQSWGIFPDQQAAYGSGFAAALLLAAILAGGFLSRRFWCRSLCPLGALLGLVARVPLFRRRVGTACNECTLCQLDCKMDAIGEKGQRTSTAECIFCYSCAELCPQEAIRMAPGKPEPGLKLDLDRRRLVTGIGVGTVWGLGATSALARRPTRDGESRITGKWLIRPPGSAAEELFTERCVRCGACMKVCPTNGLQPALAEGGLGAIWTPVLMPRVGECSQNCNLCGEVCPTDAIESFAVPEKEHLFIGRAVINRSSCVVWESGKQCLVCDEVCSYSAIYWLDKNGSAVEHPADGDAEPRQGFPYVDPARCVGCGICEYNCPAGGPDAAIRVTRDGDKRHLSRAEQKAWQEANWTEREGKPSLR